MSYSPAGDNSTTGPTTAAAPASAGAEPLVDDEALVYHVNLLFIGLLAAYVLVRLPGAIALFGTSKEWFNGHILRNVPFRSQRRLAAQTSAYPPNSSKEGAAANNWASDDSHAPYAQSERLNEKGAPITMRFPPHISTCPRVLRPLLAPLRMRIAPGFSTTQFIILVVYFYVLVYAGFYRSNIFSDPVRTGWIAVSQLPFVFAFAQKNNVLGSLLGYGYEKLNFLHRFAGRIVLIAANLHSLRYLYSWSLNGTLAEEFKDPETIWGLIALLCIDIIFFFSTAYWRQKAYNIFLGSHILGFVLVLPALYLHKAEMLTYVVACAIIFGFDHLMRVAKSRVAIAHIRPLPELELTRVEIPSINAGWRAGQHVRLRVLSSGLGWIGWAENHPFTIASVSKSQEGMVLLCKKAGGWTRRLYEIAKRGGYTEGGIGREIRVVVEGPYGGPQHTLFSSFSGAVFVVGGSGITFALAAIQDLIERDLKGESRVKIIELVWVVPDPASLGPLLPTLCSLIQQSVFTPLRISVFYSRAPTGKQPAFFASSTAGPFIGPSPTPAGAYANPLADARIPKRPPPLNLQETQDADLYRSRSAKGDKIKRTGSGPRSAAAYHARQPPPEPQPVSPTEPPLGAAQGGHFPPGLTLAPGKPRLLKFIESALQRAVTLSHGSSFSRVKDDELKLSGLVVAVCGPVGLADDVAAAVSGVDPVRRDQVGGVELFEEVFGW
ncbi:hypothetical protein BDN70DRAFT_688824 [Pholiota conissans]|uniref:ferric-chelate reductase (NADPH) n=1 Tax=Pholiota conissans TaxID=109636 RepID=A0A9P5Z4Y2_9AGAR|nr:hypothetical protein BDN70DRAFT_688824 [Pholiota conissans]